MKKTISILCLLTIILLLDVGCSNSNKNSTAGTSASITDNQLSEYSALICGFPDLGSGVNYSFADREEYEDNIPTAKAEFTIGNNCYSASYVEISYRNYNYFPEYKYIDSEGNDFSVDDTGKLTFCFFREKESNKESNIVLSEDECLQIAKEMLQNIVDISQYEIEIKANDDRKNYDIKFTKYIGEIETTDCAIVTVLYNGNIDSYSASMLGRVPKDTDISTINFDQVRMAMKNRVDQIYKDAKNKYDRVEYDPSDLRLTVLKDGRIGVVGYIDVHCINKVGEYEIISGELISMVVPVD